MMNLPRPNLHGLATTRAALQEIQRCLGKFHKLRQAVIESDAEKAKYDRAVELLREGCRLFEEIRFKSGNPDDYPAGG